MTASTMLNLLKGVTFCTLWYFSIFFGFLALYCPLLPLLVVSNYAFRNITDKIFSFWELYPTALLQFFFGTKIYVHGDYVDSSETSIIIVNHRTRVDWNYIWLCMFHATRKPPYLEHEACPPNGALPHLNGGPKLSNGSARPGRPPAAPAAPATPATRSFLRAFNQQLRVKYVLKDEIRHIPGPGWVMQMNCYMYIKRNWEQDEAEIGRVLDYLRDMDYSHQLLIFPEGTDLSEDNLIKSDSFAKKNNLMPYRQVLHPRTRGFSHVARLLRPQMAAVYDIAVAYEGRAGKEGCSLRDLLTGRFPPAVHFSIKRYPVSSIPEDDESICTWLNERWKSKEEQLKSFYKYGRFVDAVNRLEHRERGELVAALVFWTCLVLGCFLSLCLSWRVRLAAGLLCLSMVLLGVCCRGFHHLEMGLYKFKTFLLRINTPGKKTID